MEQLWEDLRLFQEAFIGGAIAAGLLAFLGLPVVLRRIVFVGIALSQWAAVGIAFSFLAQTIALFGESHVLGLCRNHWVMAAVGEGLGLLLLLRVDERSVSRETRIGIGWAVAGALAVLFVSQSPVGMEELKNLLTGEALFIGRDDLWLLGGTAVVVLVPGSLFLARFLLVAFDRDLAVSLGMRVAAWDALFYALLGLTLAVTIHLVGVLFAVAFLVIPPAAALSLARRQWTLVLVSTGIGVGSWVAGFVVSHRLDLPVGHAAVAAAGAAFVAARAFRALRGGA
jgi:ABC-type Mn2+/Zn2+ transport system permease subunit